MKSLVFAISGDAREAAGHSFAKTIASFDPGVDVRTTAPAELPAGTRKAIDPIALATLILSIPSAVLAVMDIRDRIEKRRRAQKMIDDAKRLRAENEVEVQIVVGGTPKALTELTADALLDIAKEDR